MGSAGHAAGLGGTKSMYKCCSENPKGKDFLEEQSADRWIILQASLKKKKKKKKRTLDLKLAVITDGTKQINIYMYE
jgi:hypothetical protein